MAISFLTPYLNFNGNAQHAIDLYQRALGATIEELLRFRDMPGASPSPGDADRVMHARLSMDGGAVMLADGPADMRVSAESNTHVCLNFDDVDDMTVRFTALSVGGHVTMALQDTFWGARFGMLTDAFGIHWMFNCAQTTR